MADDNKTINPNNVTTGGPVEGGCAYVSFDAEPNIPTSAATDITAVSSGFENLGELSDQGWTHGVSTSVNQFKGYHGKTLLSESSEEEHALKLELTEVVRLSANKLRFGVSAIVTNNGEVAEIHPTAVPGQIVCIVIDELFSNGIKQRTVCPRAKINSVDDEAHQKGSLLVYGMTFDLLVDEDGVPYHQYRAKLADTVKPDVTLATLVIGSLTLTPAFHAGSDVEFYRASTTSSSDTVSATATDSEATVAIKVNGSSHTSGQSASWTSGPNVVNATVTNDTESAEYTVIVTKS